MSSKQVLIEWRTSDRWHGVQQKRPRKSIQPKGALEVGQKLKVKFNRHFYDAVAVESWQPLKAKVRIFLFRSFFLFVHNELFHNYTRQ